MKKLILRHFIIIFITIFSFLIISCERDDLFKTINKSLKGAGENEDAAGFTIGSISGNTDEDGGTATFTVHLNTPPTANVTIPLASSDTSEGTVTPTSLVFTAATYATAQTVTVTGQNDALVDGNISYTIELQAVSSSDAEYNGLDPADVNVTNIDTTVASTLTVVNIISPVDGGTSVDVATDIVIQFNVSLETSIKGDIEFASPTTLLNQSTATFSYSSTSLTNDTLHITPMTNLNSLTTYSEITISGYYGLGEPIMNPYSDFNYDFTTTGPGCGGYSEGGYCWYLGSMGEHCDDACNSNGGFDLGATRNYAGSMGTNANCDSLLNALGAPGSGAPTDNNSLSWAGGCAAADSGQRWRFTLVATEGSWSSSSYYRVCACND